MSNAFFRLMQSKESDVLYPLPFSASGWSSDQIRGMAVSGALARATEQVASQLMPEMVPARWTVDLFRLARVRPTTAATTILKQGGRIGIIDAVLLQDGRPVARSRALFARTNRSLTGHVWRPEHPFRVPPQDLVPADGELRVYYTEASGWTARSEELRKNSPRQIWHFPIVLVENEHPTPFQMVAAVADVSSPVVNTGQDGLEFINVDIDLAVTRLPASMEVGLLALDRSENGGVSVGTVVLFDREGPLGSATTVALASPGSHIDPRDRRPGAFVK